jgi:hypothetical protein
MLLSKPGVEGARHDTDVRAGQEGIAHELRTERAIVPAREQSGRVAACDERAASHIDRVVRFRTGDLADPVRRLGERGIHEGLRDIAHVDRLHQHRGKDARAILSRPTHDLTREVEELRRADYRPGHNSLADRTLLGAFRRSGRP